MDIALRIALFPDLHERAQASCGGGNPYDWQKKLIAIYRERGSRFMARMPLRHRYKCANCGMSNGEAIIYLEDPQLPLGEHRQNEMWPNPVGACATISASALHQVVAHAKEATPELVTLLSATTA